VLDAIMNSLERPFGSQEETKNAIVYLWLNTGFLAKLLKIYPF
jgi:hypothetical protein